VLSAANVDIRPFTLAMADINRRGDRACMWALREAGRQTKRAARKKVRVKSGLLRDSLGSGKLKTVSPRTYRLTVQPRGPKAYLYAGKIEELDHYMQAGYEQVAPKFPEIQEKAMARVVAKYGA
jgi:hypothetical protein